MSCEHCGGEMTCVCDPLDGAIREILRLREINEELQYKNNVLNESLKTLNDRTKKAYNQLSYYENMLTIEDAPLTKLYTGETILTVNSIKIGDLLIKYGNLRKENEKLKREIAIDESVLRDIAGLYSDEGRTAKARLRAKGKV